MDLSIIIVNYKSKELLERCLASIKRFEPKVSYEVVVIDNDKDNIGFARGVNRGIKKAKGNYILLLNPDTEVKKGTIDSLYEFALETPDAGAVGAKLLNPGGSAQNSVYHFPSFFGAIRQFWFGEKDVYEKYTPEGNRPVTVDVAVMGAFLITAHALRKIGNLNEKYFMYFEDIDYCWRLKKAGLNVYYLPDAEVIHHHGASGKDVASKENQWRRLIPSSKIYHGIVGHYLINAVLWSGQKFGSIIPPVLITLLTIPAVFSMLRPGYFIMQDDLQAFRVFEMNRCYSDGQIPCRWVPDAGYQYGYPQFNYYPPLPYYIGAGLVRLGIQNIDSVKILFILGYILSGLTMYLLVKELLDKWSGTISALLYTYIPYKAVEVYVRGALSEFWAQIFFPLILWAIYKLVKSGKTKYLIWLGVSISLLMTTHSLMTVIFAPVAIIWGVFWLFRNRWKNIGKVIFGGILGFGLSAFFVLPVLFERQFAHVESLLSGYFDYRQHFVSLYKLFVSREWGYGSSGFPNEKLNLSLGIVQWAIGLVATPIIAFFSLRKNKKLSLLTFFLAFLSLASVYMIHIRSSFIWAHLPFLWYLQFPWRFLAVAIFMLCLLTAIGVYMSGKYKYIIGIILVLISFGLTINYFVPKAWLNITDVDKFSGQSWEKQLTISIFDYLPIYATLPPWQRAPNLPEVLSGKATFEDYKKGSDYQAGIVTASQDSLIRMPLFDFPGMVVKIDGTVVSHVHDNCTGERYCLGLITFYLPSGRHLIDVRLTDTPVRSVGNIVTLISVAAITFLLIDFERNGKIFS